MRSSIRGMVLHPSRHGLGIACLVLVLMSRPSHVNGALNTEMACDCSSRVISTNRTALGVPPTQPPPELLCAYTRCGTIPLLYKENNFPLYVDDTRGGRGVRPKYAAGQIRDSISSIQKTLVCNPNGVARQGCIGTLCADKVAMWPADMGGVPAPFRIYYALHKYQHKIKGKVCLVIGSNSLTAESILLALGARLVYVMEYNQQQYEWPQLRSWPANNWQFPADDTPSFIASISSYDHDGLGRYGDPLAPDGDLLSMDEARNFMLTDSNAIMLLTVPVGPDVVAWNMHRRYGPIRLPLLLHGFDILDRIGWDEQVLSNPASVRKTHEPVFLLSAAPSGAASVPPMNAADGLTECAAGEACFSVDAV